MSDPLAERAAKVPRADPVKADDPLAARAAKVPRAEAGAMAGADQYQMLNIGAMFGSEASGDPSVGDVRVAPPTALEQRVDSAASKADILPEEKERLLKLHDTTLGTELAPSWPEQIKAGGMADPVAFHTREPVPRTPENIEAHNKAIEAAFEKTFGPGHSAASIKYIRDQIEITEARLAMKSIKDDSRDGIRVLYVDPDKIKTVEDARHHLGILDRAIARRRDKLSSHPSAFVGAVANNAAKMATAGLLDVASLKADSPEEAAEIAGGLEQAVDESGVAGKVTNMAAQLFAAMVPMGKAIGIVRGALVKRGLSEVAANRLASSAVMSAYNATVGGAEAVRQGADAGEITKAIIEGGALGAATGATIESIAPFVRGKVKTSTGKIRPARPGEVGRLREGVAGFAEDFATDIPLTGGDIEEALYGGIAGGVGGLATGKGQYRRAVELADKQRSKVAEAVFESQRARMEAREARAAQGNAEKPKIPDGVPKEAAPAVTKTAQKIAAGPEPTQTEIDTAAKVLDIATRGQASGEIDTPLVDAWTQGLRTGKPVDTTTLNMGANPVRAVGVAAEVQGAIKRWVIDAPLRLGDKAVVAAARKVRDFGPEGRTLGDFGRAAKETAKSYVPVYRRGQEFWSRLAEMQGERQLGMDDAKRAMRDFVRDPDTRKPYTKDQQEAITRWFEGEASDVELVRAAGEATAKKARFWRDVITGNQRKLRDLGWMSEDVLAEWEGRWLPRAYRNVEQVKRLEAEEAGVPYTKTGGKRVPSLHRRRSRFDVEDADGNLVEQFTTREEADAYVGRIRGQEESTRRDQLAEARRLEDQAKEYDKPTEQIMTVRVRRDGDEGVVSWETVQGGRSKTHTERFEDVFDAQDFAKELQREKAEARANQAKRADIARKWRVEAQKIRNNLEKFTKLTIKEPLSKEQREALGEIRDPAVLVARAVASQASAISVMNLLDNISKNPRWVSDVKTGPFTEQIPTGKQYGSLAGKYVAPSVRKQIQGILREADLFDRIGGLADTLLSQWKYGKTVLRPATHGRNILGNILFAELEGTSWLDQSNWKNFVEGIKILRAKPGESRYEALRFLIKERIAGGDFLSTEVLDLADEVRRMAPGRTWREKVDLYVAEKMGNLKRGKVFEVVPGQADVGKLLTALYRLEDLLPKMSAFVRRVREGETPQQAAKSVRRYYPQYDEAWTARLMNARGFGASATRQIAMPFMTFFAEALRILRIHAAERPVTLTALITGLQAAGMALAEAAGLTQEEVEKLNRTAPNHRKIGLTDWLIPWRGENGELRALDLTYTIPLADEIQTAIDTVKVFLGDEDAGQAMGSASPQSSPLGPGPMLLAQLLANKNFFKDRPIDNSDGRGSFSATSRAKGRRDKIKFILETLLPPTFPGGRDIRVIQETLSGIPVDRDGRVRRDKVLVALDLLAGIKVNEFDPERDLEFSRRKVESRARKKIAGIAAAVRDRSLTREEREEEIAAIKRDLVRAANFAVWIEGGSDEKYKTFADLPLRIRERVAVAEATDPDKKRRPPKRLFAAED